MKVNYIAELNRFQRFAMDEELSGYAMLLWHTLMGLFNDRGEGDEWPESIRVGTRKMLAFFPFSQDTLERARIELAEAGRIVYTPGTRGERAEYRLILFEAVDRQASTSSVTDHDDGATSSVRLTPDSFPKGEASEPVENSDFSTSAADYPPDNPPIKPLSAVQNRTHIQTSNAYAYTRDDDDERDARPRLVILSEFENQEQDEAMIREAFRERLPELPVTKAALHDLLMIARDLGQTPGVVCDAVAVAARRCARSPVDYILTLLDDWSRDGVRTQQDLGELLVMRDALSGRIAVGGVTRQDLDEARERRRAR